MQCNCASPNISDLENSHLLVLQATVGSRSPSFYPRRPFAKDMCAEILLTVSSWGNKFIEGLFPVLLSRNRPHPCCLYIADPISEPPSVGLHFLLVSIPLSIPQHPTLSYSSRYITPHDSFGFQAISILMDATHPYPLSASGLMGTSMP